ncbi:hypothetical protein [Lichenicoccus sp.]|uniref:hypothetical protein n=1 Tax=Lichenicoccus sp. TaxID=2781899 RepID=UPI003D0CD369
MTSLTIRATIALLLLLLSWGPAKAAEGGADATTSGLQLPLPCASVHASGLQSLAPPAHGVTAEAYRVHLPAAASRHAVSMSASSLRVESGTADTSDADLERASSAAAAALLVALSGDHHGGCDTALLHDAAAPIVHGLAHGGGYVATWLNVTLRGASGVVTAHRMQLRLEAHRMQEGLHAPGADAAAPVQVAFSLEGVAGRLKPPTLLPDTLAWRISLPPSSLPTLLAATGGSTPSAQIPVTVDDLRLTQGKSIIDAKGSAIAAPTPLASSADLHVTARDYDDLVEKAASADMVRLHTALFLSSLVAKRDADGLQWQVTYHDGVLAVNHVPIPVR